MKFKKGDFVCCILAKSPSHEIYDLPLDSIWMVEATTEHGLFLRKAKASGAYSATRFVMAKEKGFDKLYLTLKDESKG